MTAALLTGVSEKRPPLPAGRLVLGPQRLIESQLQDGHGPDVRPRGTPQQVGQHCVVDPCTGGCNPQGATPHGLTHLERQQPHLLRRRVGTWLVRPVRTEAGRGWTGGPGHAHTLNECSSASFRNASLSATVGIYQHRPNRLRSGSERRKRILCNSCTFLYTATRTARAK